MKRNLLTSLLLFIIVMLSAQSIRLNQIGYYPEEQKYAIITSGSPTAFDIISTANAQVVYSGTLSSSSYWTPSAETVKLADFSDFTDVGEYYLKVSGIPDSYTFEIKDNVHREVLKGLVKAYYYNRASTALTATHAGIHARPLGHPDNVVYIHSSAASTQRPTGSTISSPKGWYDAGDYGKYIVNSGISTYTILALYEHFPELFDELDMNIPESSNNVPDVLDEAKWNLDWMLTMQDPNDGGVYHKLTTLNFTGEDMPHEATADRYVVMKGTAATLDFAAVMAQASRIFAAFETEFPGYSAQCLSAAEDAWAWAQSNSNVSYSQPADVRTGTYGDGNFSDEFDWAAAELYITTQNDSYYNATSLITSGINTPGWPSVQGLTWVSLAHHIDDLTAIANTTTIRNKIINHADDILDNYNSSAYRVSIENFYWGSNSLAANEGLMLIQAYKLTNDATYLNAALSDLDYILGRNATGYSFVTGFGDHTPMYPHHRQSQSDGIAAPVPGFVAGGPNPGQQDGCSYPSNSPARSYVDDWCSYASNEVTINWNAPVAYMAAAMETYFGVETPVTGIDPTNASDLLVFPSVSSTGFYVKTTAPVSYSIYDVQGRLMENASAVSGQKIGQQLPNGFYLVKVTGEATAATFRVVKQ